MEAATCATTDTGFGSLGIAAPDPRVKSGARTASFGRRQGAPVMRIAAKVTKVSVSNGPVMGMSL